MSEEKKEPQRVYTLEQARRLLPRVEYLVTHLQRNHAYLRDLLELTRREQGKEAVDLEFFEAQAKSNPLIQKVVRRLQDFMDELDGLGLVFQSVEYGLVDFPHIRDGKLVFLCWQIGERDITHWHHTDAGYAGRQVLEGATEELIEENCTFH